jgi:hypothetical protein
VRRVVTAVPWHIAALVVWLITLVARRVQRRNPNGGGRPLKGGGCPARGALLLAQRSPSNGQRPGSMAAARRPRRGGRGETSGETSGETAVTLVTAEGGARELRSASRKRARGTQCTRLCPPAFPRLPHASIPPLLPPSRACALPGHATRDCRGDCRALPACAPRVPRECVCVSSSTQSWRFPSVRSPCVTLS